MYNSLKYSIQIMGILICTAHMAWAASSIPTENCEAWKQVKPKIENLKRVLGCGPQFSAKECAENSGYGLKVAAAGAVAGSIAAANIRKNIPTVWGLNVSSTWWYSFIANSAMAAPSCGSEVKMAAHRVAEDLRTSITVKRLVIANDLTDRVAKESPQLDQLSRIVAGTFTKGEESYTTKLKHLNEKLKPLGIEFQNITTCKGNIEVCNKLMALSRRHSIYNVKENIGGNAELLAKYFQDDQAVIKYQEAVKNSQQLIKQVESGKIIDEASLAKFYSNATKIADGSVHHQLATTGNYIASILPQAEKIGVKAEADSLIKSSASFLAKHSVLLKKILPFGLSGLIAVSTGASADEIAQETVSGALPLVVTESVSSAGCDELDSPYFPRHVESGKCVPTASMTNLTEEFLVLPENEQMAQVCRFPNYLPDTINKITNNYFPQGMNLTCGLNSATASTSSGAEKSFYGKFEYSASGDLSTASIMASGLRNGVSAYDLQFKDGAIAAGQIRNGKSLNIIKPGLPSEMAHSVGNDFAGRQVISLAAQNCCAGGSGDSCNHFSKVNKSGTNTSSPSNSSPSEYQPGVKGVR